MDKRVYRAITFLFIVKYPETKGTPVPRRADAREKSRVMFVDYATIALPDSDNPLYCTGLIITHERSKAISATHLLLYPEAVV